MNKIVFISLIFLIITTLTIFIGCIKLKKDRNLKKNIIFCVSILTILTFLIIILCTINLTPKLELKGNKIIEINVNDEYIDEGFSVNKKNLNNLVKINSNVDISKPGEYKITYSLKYQNKNIVTERKVIVKDNIAPKIELVGENNINKSIESEYVELGYKAIDNVDGDITDKVKIDKNIINENKYEIIYKVEDSSGNVGATKRIVNIINDNTGVIYLTFDDGPSSITSKILDILKKEKITATFFVVNYPNYYDDVVKRIVSEGHTIALHSYTHNYKLIYASENAYFDDLYKLRDKVKYTTGVETNIVRFPGGSSNTISSFNKGIMSRLVNMVKEKGFHYFDWNVDSSDAWTAKNKDDVYNNVISGIRKNRSNVVLMHDLGGNIKTLEALPDIISTIKKKGYSFDKITYDTPMVIHRTSN